MTLESLEGPNAPYVVEFNPWQWTAQEKVAQAFFEQVGASLGQEQDGDKARQAAKEWLEYGQYLKIGSHVTTGVRKAVPVALAILGALNLAGGVIPQLNGVLIAVGIIAMLLAGVLSWSSGLLEKVGKAIEARASTLDVPIKLQRKKLFDALTALDRPLLLVIDDIDRLTSGEIALLFQLVKANADFPNLIFLLLFDRDVVSKALDRVVDSKGSEFLSKIVQVGLHVPGIDPAQVHKLLFEGLDRLLTHPDAQRLFDPVRWGNVFHGGLKHYFTNIRDVNRFIGSLSFHIGIFSGQAAFEVNPVDLIAIEAIRVFDSPLYLAIRDSKELLTSTEKDDAEHKRSNAVKALVSLVPEARRSQASELLSELFPAIEWVFGGSSYGSDFKEGWFKDLLIAHEQLFDKYFFLAVPQSDLSENETKGLIEKAGDRTALAAALQSIRGRGLIGPALERLEAFQGQVPLDNAATFITALFDIGDDLPDVPGTFVGWGYEWTVFRIARAMLKREPNLEKRWRTFRTAVEQSSGIVVPLDVISSELDKEARAKYPGRSIFHEEQLDELKKLGVSKIESAAADGKLKPIPKLPKILFAWSSWSSPDRPRVWVDSFARHSDAKVELLKTFVLKSTSQGFSDRVARIHRNIKLSDLEPFFDLASLKKELAGIDRSSLDEEGRMAVDAFERAMKRREEGKPESDWPTDDEP